MDNGGISITGLTVGGAALTAIGGMVGAWIRARMGRTEITPQPLEVRAAPNLIDRTACGEYRAINAADHSNLFARVSSAEQRIAAAEAALHALDDHLKSMDNKLDVLLQRSRK